MTAQSSNYFFSLHNWIRNQLSLYLAPVGGYCSPTVTCSGGALCRLGVCVCDVGEMALDGRCVPDVAPFPTLQTTLAPKRRCAKSDDCKEGAQCIDGQCVCPPGTENNNLLGDGCETESILSKKKSSSTRRFDVFQILF